MSMTSERRALSIFEVCQLYGWQRSYFYRLKKKGKAPRSVKICGRRMVLIDDLTAWENELNDGDNP